MKERLVLDLRALAVRVTAVRVGLFVFAVRVATFLAG